MKQAVLVKLSPKWIDAYLQRFSDEVQAVLHVKGIGSERAYLVQRIKEEVPFFFVLLDQLSKEVMGAIEIRHPTHRSQLYCWINERWWGTGRFKSAMLQAAHFYFEKSGESTITACVDCENVRSYYALKKVGFLEKGIAQGPHGLQYEMILEK